MLLPFSQLMNWPAGMDIIAVYASDYAPQLRCALNLMCRFVVCAFMCFYLLANDIHGTGWQTKQSTCLCQDMLRCLVQAMDANQQCHLWVSLCAVSCLVVCNIWYAGTRLMEEVFINQEAHPYELQNDGRLEFAALQLLPIGIVIYRSIRESLWPAEKDARLSWAMSWQHMQ